MNIIVQATLDGDGLLTRTPPSRSSSTGRGRRRGADRCGVAQEGPSVGPQPGGLVADYRVDHGEGMFVNVLESSEVRAT